MDNSQNKNSDSALRVNIFSDDIPISDKIFELISVYVYKAVNKIGKAKLIFKAGNTPNSNVPESDDSTFDIGKTIRIEAGYGNDESLIFEGTVTTHKVILGGNNGSYLEIECKDLAYQTTLARKNNVFENKKDCEVIQAILGEYSNLLASVDTTITKHSNLVQYYCSDWDFMLARANANGLVIATDGKNIHIKKPNLSTNSKLKVTYGIDLVEFHGELSETIDNEAMTLPPDMFVEESALQALTDSQRLKVELSKILGYCKFQGNAKAVHGGLIELNGFGKRFNGNVYVGYVEHEIKGNDWITTAGFGLPYENNTEKHDEVALSASGVMPEVGGLHIGFINDDPDQPIILGSLYSNKHKPVDKIRSLTTKSNMRIEFEEEKKTITIKTPGENIITISEKDKGIQLVDQNKNKITMNSNGIIIDSINELTLKAKTNITIDAGVKLDAKAKGDLNLEGSRIEGKAKTSMKMAGAASAEFSASEQTVVKGAMVMIN